MSSLQEPLSNSNNSFTKKVSNFFSKHQTTILIVVVILVFIIVLFAIFRINLKDIPGSFKKFFKGEKPIFEAETKEVFNIKSNMFTYNEAELVCKAYGAELATLEQLVDAHQNGANWCNYGWTKEQLALYPIQEKFSKQLKKDGKEGQCGLPGLNGGYFANPNIKFGVNCYGVKPDPSESERFKHDLNTLLVSKPENKKIQEIKGKIDELSVSPFNSDKWSNT